jgi:hypothetical protein
MTNKTLTADDLAQFTGTEDWHRHGLVRNVLYTDGVKFVAERGAAYWLLDKVATLQLEERVRAEPFQVWRLKVQGTAATLTCDDGNDNIIHCEQIHYTDFPLDEIAFYVEGDVILLPSEH